MLEVREVVSLGRIRKVNDPATPNDQSVSTERIAGGKISTGLDCIVLSGRGNRVADRSGIVDLGTGKLSDCACTVKVNIRLIQNNKNGVVLSKYTGRFINLSRLKPM